MKTQFRKTKISLTTPKPSPYLPSISFMFKVEPDPSSCSPKPEILHRPRESPRAMAHDMRIAPTRTDPDPTNSHLASPPVSRSSQSPIPHFEKLQVRPWTTSEQNLSNNNKRRGRETTLAIPPLARGGDDGSSLRLPPESAGPRGGPRRQSALRAEPRRRRLASLLRTRRIRQRFASNSRNRNRRRVKMPAVVLVPVLVLACFCCSRGFVNPF